MKRLLVVLITVALASISSTSDGAQKTSSKNKPKVSQATFKVLDITTIEAQTLKQGLESLINMNKVVNQKYSNCEATVVEKINAVNLILNKKSSEIEKEIYTLEDKLKRTTSEANYWTGYLKSKEGTLTDKNRAEITLKLQGLEKEAQEISQTIKSKNSDLSNVRSLVQVPYSDKEIADEGLKCEKIKDLFADNILLLYKQNNQIKPIEVKLIKNFCGLNKTLLSESLAILNKSDPLTGTEKYNKSVLEPLFRNLNSISKNSQKSITNSTTDTFLATIYPSIQLFYTGTGVPNNILMENEWRSVLAQSEYGSSVISFPGKYEILKTRLQKTVEFCKKNV